MRKAIFEGLVSDEYGNSLSTAYVGEEPCYVILDGDFKRHVSSEQVDKQVFEFLRSQMEGKEDLITDQTAKMIGQDDVFTRAVLMNQLRNMDKQFNQLMETGIPAEGRTYLGMMGFKVIVNVHGEVVKVEQPSQESGGEGEE
jgi:hypothetical protein